MLLLDREGENRYFFWRLNIVTSSFRQLLSPESETAVLTFLQGKWRCEMLVYTESQYPFLKLTPHTPRTYNIYIHSLKHLWHTVTGRSEVTILQKSRNLTEWDPNYATAHLERGKEVESGPGGGGGVTVLIWRLVNQGYNWVCEPTLVEHTCKPNRGREVEKESVHPSIHLFIRPLS